MFNFLKRLFGKKREAEAGSIAMELWMPDFKSAADRRFEEVDESSHHSSWKDDAYTLALHKKDVFAWVDSVVARYSDFVAEGEFSFGAENGHSACGFAFRIADDRNFMSLLVSNKGFFRLDAVFNGSQRPLIAWTETPGPIGDVVDLRIIARSNSFTIMIDDVWAGEVTDDTVSSGFVAVAGQNYGDRDKASFSLRSILIESRPLEVETWHYRYGLYVIPPRAARRRLAETFLAMGEYLDAAIQIRKIAKHESLDAKELFLEAEAALRLGLYDDAEKSVNACLALDPANAEACFEKANLLYLQSRFIELKGWLDALPSELASSATMLNMKGHARFNLGDYRGAAAAYEEAAGIDPEQALLWLNAARSRESAGDSADAVRLYLAAARRFFEANDFADLEVTLGRLEDLDAHTEETELFRAKTLYHDRRYAEAEAIFEKAVANGTRDSASFYMLGLIRSNKGRKDEAVDLFRKARELEPDFALYHFRLADALYAMGAADTPEFSEALALALEKEPDDGWVQNLAGMRCLDRYEYEDAERHISRACALLPDETGPAVNLSELRSRLGDVDGALAALAKFEDGPAANQRGNVFARASRLLEAATEYRRAILAADDAEYRCNLAACCIELEAYSEADDNLRVALERAPSPRAYLLAGNLSCIYGDYVRGEAAYRTGLDAAPGNADLLAGLSRCYLSRRDGDKALATAKLLDAADPDRAASLRMQIREVLMERLSCADCSREWWVPRSLPAQSAESIRDMPPDDSPAGACPVCGKTYCIACRKEQLSAENRLTCPTCSVPLKLSDNRLRFLVRKAIAEARQEAADPR